jgi:hypothetical protein
VAAASSAFPWQFKSHPYHHRPAYQVHITHQQTEKAANAAENKELAFLRSAFELAKQSGIIKLSPYFPMFEGDNVRVGFLRDDHYAKLTEACSPKVSG